MCWCVHRAAAVAVQMSCLMLGTHCCCIASSHGSCQWLFMLAMEGLHSLITVQRQLFSHVLCCCLCRCAFLLQALQVLENLVLPGTDQLDVKDKSVVRAHSSSHSMSLKVVRQNACSTLHCCVPGQGAAVCKRCSCNRRSGSTLPLHVFVCSYVCFPPAAAAAAVLAWLDPPVMGGDCACLRPFLIWHVCCTAHHSHCPSKLLMWTAHLCFAAQVATRLRGSISSKQLGYEDLLAPLVAEACIDVVPTNPNNFNVDNVRIVKIMGGALPDSQVRSRQGGNSQWEM